MRRLTPAALAGLAVLTAVAEPARAVFPFHWHHKYPLAPLAPVVPTVPAVPVVPVAPTDPTSPLTPGDVVMALRVINGVLTWVQERRSGGGAPTPNNNTTTMVEPKVSKEVFDSIARSDTTLKTTVDATNSLLAKVRANDHRYTTTNLPDVKVVAPAAGGSGGSGFGNVLPTPKP